MKDTNIALLFLVERTLREQVGHPENGIHRGSYFVTHGGQEFALGSIGGFRRRFGALKIFLRTLAYDHLPELRANVPHDGQEILVGRHGLKRKELENPDDLVVD